MPIFEFGDTGFPQLVCHHLSPRLRLPTDSPAQLDRALGRTLHRAWKSLDMFPHISTLSLYAFLFGLAMRAFSFSVGWSWFSRPPGMLAPDQKYGSFCTFFWCPFLLYWFVLEEGGRHPRRLSPCKQRQCEEFVRVMHLFICCIWNQYWDWKNVKCWIGQQREIGKLFEIFSLLSQTSHC